jgi:hypothetical protein
MMMLALHFVSPTVVCERALLRAHTVEPESRYGFFVLLLSATIKPVKIESSDTREQRSNTTTNNGGWLKITITSARHRTTSNADDGGSREGELGMPRKSPPLQKQWKRSQLSPYSREGEIV